MNLIFRLVFVIKLEYFCVQNLLVRHLILLVIDFYDHVNDVLTHLIFISDGFISLRDDGFFQIIHNLLFFFLIYDFLLDEAQTLFSVDVRWCIEH